MRQKVFSWTIWIFGFLALSLALSVFSLCVGSAAIPVKEIIPLILAGPGSIEHSILVNIRLPRILLAFTVGGALSLAGVTLQGMFRNPLVEPYTLGISGGAVLGVCLHIILGLSAATLPAFGFLGALGVVLLTYSLSLKRGVLRMQGLLLTGVMVSFICSSLFMLVMAISHTEDLHGIIFWIMGFLEEPNFLLIKLMSAVSFCLLAVSYLFCFDLNALCLGEQEALHLGVNTERTKRLLFVIASLLTGCSVAVAGIIGFVGLVVPHFVRMFVGRDYRILLISSFLCGGSFLIFCDTLARTVISPLELPVGVITGILGGSLFIYALGKRANS
ncbi:FecCD family ABC transporter permease [Candidatus Omnitrophota bacterium]